jgi:hypothetical protein
LPFIQMNPSRWSKGKADIAHSWAHGRARGEVSRKCAALDGQPNMAARGSQNHGPY